jgi:hypothetical protein
LVQLLIDARLIVRDRVIAAAPSRAITIVGILLIANLQWGILELNWLADTTSFERHHFAYTNFFNKMCSQF